MILIEDLSTNFRRSLKMYNNNLFIVYLILTIISEGAVSYFLCFKENFYTFKPKVKKTVSWGGGGEISIHLTIGPQPGVDLYFIPNIY